MNTIRLRLSTAGLLTLALAACTQNPVTPGAETPPPAPVSTPAQPDSSAAKPAAPDTSGRGTTGLEQTTIGPGGSPPAALPSIGAPAERSVYFDFDKYDIRDEFKKLLADHGKFMTERKDARMLIQGNADERGSREYNLALGQRRADAVKRVMLLQGIKEESLESVSLGEEKPKATGHDEASWAENRRADMLYKGEY